MNTGWKLDRGQRETLLARFSPRYPRIVADHVTYPVEGDPPPLPPAPGEARIVGRADDGHGVEAMVVAIDGATARHDGSTWHVTWSLGPGRDAVESNAVIAAGPWEAFDGPALMLTPAHW